MIGLRASWIGMTAVALLFFSCGKDEQASKTEASTKAIEGGLKATVLVVALDDEDNEIAYGSGFVVTKSGRIVTNQHVIENANSLIVRHSESVAGVPAKVFASDPLIDLAVLESDLKLPPLPLGDDGAVKVGDPIYAIGNPQGLEGTVSDGIVSAFREDDDVGRVIQITAAISSGSSGGPVINAKGEAIAVTVAYLQGGQNLNFAMPISSLKKVLEARKKTRNHHGTTQGFKKAPKFAPKSQLASYNELKIEIPSMEGHSAYHGEFGKMLPKNNDNLGRDKISSTSRFLVNRNGAFVAHNNGLEEVMFFKFKSSLVLVETYPKNDNIFIWTFHLGYKDQRGRYLATMIKTRGGLMTSTSHFWGMASIVGL
jgi:hypothetical protein